MEINSKFFNQLLSVSIYVSRLILVRFFFILALMLTYTFPQFAQKADMEKFEGIAPRSIGPAGMSGRVTAIDVVLKNPEIIYVGTASGGLWRSTSGGIKWAPIFDEQPVASIGAVAVDQKNPVVIWVGTGEGNPRNSQTSGNGIYKSIDSGRTWVHLGLDETRNIQRIIIDPNNSDVAYVAAIGTAWGDTPERGVYKTSNGGKTWQKILYVDEETGAADLVMDPSNPNKLFAAMWQYRRWPWFFNSGGPSSGIYVTFDGGSTWKKRTSDDGLPKGNLGRIGLAIANSSPNVVYATIEAKKNALYRSDDGGYKWKKITDKDVGNRPFYYSDIKVDPKNENRIYDIHTSVTVSEDGGKTFKPLVTRNKVHPDHHAWWIHPNDPSFMIDGNDGGMAITHDKGKTWRFIENLPLAQFYHINYDMESPYNVYGGLQDNGSWRGPSEVFRNGGIRNQYWEMLSFGDGFDVVPDLGDSRYGYSMSQGGNLVRYDSKTGSTKFIKPIHPDGVYLRFNWNAGIAADPFDNTAVYYGSQFLHKSTDRGDTWEIISPDITTNDTSKQKQAESGGLTYDVTNAENFTTIISIAPSKVKKGIIWVGTDDGNVQLTKDGGKTWENVIKNIKGVPEGTWVPNIEASPVNAAEAFVVFDNHRRNDWTPYVYYTQDYGKTWKRIAGEKDVWGYALSIVQDPVEPDLIFLGTEFGLYVSFNRGADWNKWKSGYPTVSTMAMKIHPREGDLIIGTFGRAVYILDDLTPLRTIAKEGVKLLDSPLKTFSVKDASLNIIRASTGILFPAEAIFSGENKPYGAMISFIVNNESKSSKADKEKKDSVKIEVLNNRGELIRTLKVEAKPGLNRTYWDLTRKGVRYPSQEKPKKDSPEPRGPQVLPGTYTIRINSGNYKDSTTVNVKLDQRINVLHADLITRDSIISVFMNNVAVATEAADRLRDAQKTINLVAELIDEKSDGSINVLKEKNKALQDSIKLLIELINGPDVQGIKNDPNAVRSKIRVTSRYIFSTWEAPDSTALLSLKQMENTLSEVVNKINNFFTTQWDAYKKEVEKAKVSIFENYEAIKVNK